MSRTSVAASTAGARDATVRLRQAHGLLVLDELSRAAPLRELIALLEALDDGRSHAAVAAYGALFRALVARAIAAGWTLAAGSNDGRGGRSESLLAVAIAEAALVEETTLSRWVEQAGADLPVPLLAAAAADLRALQALATSAAAASSELPSGPQESTRPGPAPAAWLPLPAARVPAAAGPLLLERLLGAPDWGTLAPDLVAHYAHYGVGPLAHYRAFRWLGAEGIGRQTADPSLRSRASGGRRTSVFPGDALVGFVPVPVPDSVRPGDLIGYEAERELLRRNTVHFLAGYPANNVLLYGDRGTGKSSSVKALLHEQSRPGEPPDLWAPLRIVEVPKLRLADFPILAELLRGRPQRFILFVDDLSFEEGETQYKDLKAVLEGGLEARPANVVVYATSNRRHLIREQFADRATLGSDEVHAQDTVQEKLSFADRFGLAITFPSPDQAAYLAIVEGLAERRGLLAATPPASPSATPPASALPKIERPVLRARAIEWAAWHNGRSGRTAKQFVDYLEGELGTRNEG